MSRFASLQGFVFVSLMIIIFFQGMLIIFEDADKTNLDGESQQLFDTLKQQIGEVQPVNTNGTNVNVNFSRDNPQISDENAFSAEFFTASTSNQDKITQIDTLKATPYLITFAAGSESNFGWFYNNIYWWISFVIMVIGFLILFRREVK